MIRFQFPDRALLLCVTLLAVLSCGSDLYAQRPGDVIFKSSRIHEINIIMTQPNFYDSLISYKKLHDSTDVTQWMKGAVIFNGVRLDSVGVRLKGNSSFGYPGMKKPIKLKFNEYVSGQNVDGLKQLNFNNNMLDPSYMREKLFLDWLNDNEMSAPRCTYARISYNGQYAGLFKIIEDVDKVFLKDRFGNNDGNLFKGDPSGSLIWMGADGAAYYKQYELQSNEKENDWSDLVRLIRVINTTPAPLFRDSLEAVLNVDSFIRDWAANNVFGNLDSYMLNPHNYFVYHNTTTGRFEWIAWDVSVVFGFFPTMKEAQTINWDIAFTVQPPQLRPLTANILSNPLLRASYQNAVCAFNDRGLNPDVLFPKIDSIAAVIRPHIYAEPDGNQMFPEPMFEGNINYQTINIGPQDIPGLKKFIAQRRNSIRAQSQAKSWNCVTTAVDDVPLPRESIAVYPNPTRDRISITIDLAKSRYTEIRICDLTGRVVENIHAGFLYEGKTTFSLNGKSSGGYALPSGSYLCIAKTIERVLYAVFNIIR